MLDDNDIKTLRKHEPYDSIWDQGKGYDKEWAKRDISYVWYVTSRDKDNPYKNLSLDERKIQAREHCKYPVTWEFHPGIDRAIQRLLGLNKTVEERLLDSALAAAEELIRYFNRASVGQTRKDENGHIIPLTPATELMKNLKEVGSVVKSLQSLREQASRAEANSQAYGKVEIGEFERV